MNTFDFIGKITVPSKKEGFIKRTSTNKKFIKVLVRQNENNSGYAYMYGDNLINGSIPVYSAKTKQRILVKYEDRFDNNILKDISYASKYKISHDNTNVEFIWKDDFMNYLYELISNLPANTTYKVSGEYGLAYKDNKAYNNFNIKSVEVNNSLRPELKLSLDLFYNYKSLDERDKANKLMLILNNMYMLTKKENISLYKYNLLLIDLILKIQLILRLLDIERLIYYLNKKKAM